MGAAHGAAGGAFTPGAGGVGASAAGAAYERAASPAGRPGATGAGEARPQQQAHRHAQATQGQGCYMATDLNI